METYNNEIWVDVIGYEGLYQVSTHGKVRNGRGTVLKPYLSNGYEKVSLTVNGKTKKWFVHRLVAINFIATPDRDVHLVVNHIDGKRTNNHSVNLEWITLSENNTHGYINKERSSTYPGVRKVMNTKKITWRAEGYLDGKKHSLGCYPTEEEAINARKLFDSQNGLINKYAEI